MANDGGSRSARLMVALRSSLRELVIVMFGVLLALWVNNWNERRKDARLEATYLERLAADVQLDTTMRNSMIRLSDSKASDLDTLDVLLRLPSGEMFDTLKFLRAIAGGSRQAFANPPVARTTFSELENTGGLRLIADPQLRSDIARYYMSAEYSDIRIDRRRTSYGPLSYRLVPQSSGV
ncbi:MAG TPA: DUF6090 family protein, partial [Longimicrobiales bacterium]|nr:DUF6090 family protein [Longimicrobiales bacterium]